MKEVTFSTGRLLRTKRCYELVAGQQGCLLTLAINLLRAARPHFEAELRELFETKGGLRQSIGWRIWGGDHGSADKPAHRLSTTGCCFGAISMATATSRCRV